MFFFTTIMFNVTEIHEIVIETVKIFASKYCKKNVNGTNTIFVKNSAEKYTMYLLKRRENVKKS